MFIGYWEFNRNSRDFPSAINAGLFTKNYTKFDVTSVLNKDLSLNEEAWDAAKPLLLTPYLSVSQTQKCFGNYR
jgi:hypothetical protein